MTNKADKSYYCYSNICLFSTSGGTMLQWLTRRLHTWIETPTKYKRMFGQYLFCTQMIYPQIHVRMGPPAEYWNFKTLLDQ